MAEQTEGGGLKGTLSNVGGAMKDGVVNSLKGLNEIENQIVTVARNTMTDTLQATGDVAGSHNVAWMRPPRTIRGMGDLFTDQTRRHHVVDGLHLQEIPFVRRFDAVGDVAHLFERRELRQLGDKILVLHRIQRILVLQLGNHQLEEVILPQLVGTGRAGSARRTRRPGAYR